jgi:hypothetical protein
MADETCKHLKLELNELRRTVWMLVLALNGHSGEYQNKVLGDLEDALADKLGERRAGNG